MLSNINGMARGLLFLHGHLAGREALAAAVRSERAPAPAEPRRRRADAARLSIAAIASRILIQIR